ncbi:hypothetical protein [Eubacterium xylanophilum]|uniref:hypothetical protein n=1 Tax=Eubacterium xylanophilum TaxID=39497 RepID=UPI0004B36E23|nr:hypothetical protein [Eubacterium xylanophilum]
MHPYLEDINRDEEMNIVTEEVQTDGKDTYYFHRYEPTPYLVLDVLFDELDLGEDDIILDYGSGLGRVLLYANYKMGCKGIGVEYSAHYFDLAYENLRSYVNKFDMKVAPIRFINQSAVDYDVPDFINMIYFFNPFSTEVFRTVLTKIQISFERAPREITFIIYYPEDETIFYIENHTSFSLVREIAGSDNVVNDRRDRFAIYSNKYE